MAYLAWFVLLLLGARTVVSSMNLISSPYLINQDPQGTPFISVLIPARNEEKSIGGVLKDLQGQSYSNFEVLVYDDQSNDQTPVIARRFEKQDDRFHLISGQSLPNHWKGKPYACSRLSREARGDYLIFLDADVQVGPQLLRKSAATVQYYDLHMLSIFPRQKMQSFGERITVPLMNWILLSLLPLPLISRTDFPSLSAANGQFMMFEGSSYREQQWHRKMKDVLVEDIAIARTMKRFGYRIQTLLGDRSIQCRMYDNYGEACRGFSRNVHAYFGNSHLMMFAFAIVSLLGFIPVWHYFGSEGLILYLGLEILNRVTVSVASRQSAPDNTLLAPVQLLAFIHIALKSLKVRYSGTTHWKGRNIKT